MLPSSPAIPPGKRVLLTFPMEANDTALLTMDRVPSITNPINPAAINNRPRLRARNFKGGYLYEQRGKYVVRFVAMAKAIQAKLTQVRSCLLPRFSDTRALR